MSHDDPEPGADTPSGSLTELLRRWSDGDPNALEALIPLVDAELRRIASQRLRRERANPTLDRTTALVNETYTRLLGQQPVSWQGRAHFLGIAARLMRQILVDHARRQGAQKRGERRATVPLSEAIPSPGRADRFEMVELVALHDALDRLGALDERQARVVELRFFGGLTIEETAEVLDVSLDTVKRDWRNARMWLRRELVGPS